MGDDHCKWDSLSIWDMTHAIKFLSHGHIEKRSKCVSDGSFSGNDRNPEEHMKNKLSLSQLKLVSFVTLDPKKVRAGGKGGHNSERPCPSMPDYPFYSN